MRETKEMYPSWGDDHDVRLGNVKICDLHDFKGHAFHVVEDTALFELAKSIEDKGVLVPLIVRVNLTETVMRLLPDIVGRQLVNGQDFQRFPQ